MPDDGDDKITIQSITSPHHTERVNRAKYEAMRRALLAVLPADPPGLTVAEAQKALLPHLDSALFPGGEKAGWWMKCVQLDLEAKHLIVREPKSPVRLRRTSANAGLDVKPGATTINKQHRSAEVDAYIRKQPPPTQRALEALRSCIHQASPSAIELMNYNIPAFALVGGGKREHQVMMAGFAKHVGFYPHPAVIEALASQLGAYKFAKGSIQFPLDAPIPKALVIKMVKTRLSQLRR